MGLSTPMHKSMNRLLIGFVLGIILCIPPITFYLWHLREVKVALITYIVSVLVIQEGEDMFHENSYQTGISLPLYSLLRKSLTLG